MEEYIFDDTIPADAIGSKIIEDVMRDDDYDLLTKQYPELNRLAERASDMEYEPGQYAEQGRNEIRRQFTTLKARINERGT